MTSSETDAANDEFNFVPAGAPAAVQNRADLRKHNVFAVALVGPPGAGKQPSVKQQRGNCAARGASQ